MLNTLRSSLFATVLLTFFGSLSPAIDNVNRINFGPSAYLAQDLFFLGARTDANDPGVFAVARTRKEVNEENGAISLCVDALAPEEAVVNGSRREVEKKKKQNKSKKAPPEYEQAYCENPVFNKGISHLALRDRTPVVVLATDDVAPVLGPNQKLCVVTQIPNQDRRQPPHPAVFTNTTRLLDADGLETSGIAGIVANNNHIFAALAPNAGTFGEEGSGITLVRTIKNKLKPVGMVADLSLKAGNLVAISQDGVIGEVVDMHWNQTLRRLYVALRVTRSDESDNGGAIALLVGRIETIEVEVEEEQEVAEPDSDSEAMPESEPQSMPESDSEAMLDSESDPQIKTEMVPTIVLSPAVALDPNNFVTNSTDFIFGFSASGGSALGISANLHKVRTLETTTQQFYAIVNGTVSDGEQQNVLYALPLVGESWTPSA